METSALYIGGSHESGNDIPVTVVETGRTKFIEGGEFSVCKAAMENNEILEFQNKTALEILHAIHERNDCKFEQGKEHIGNHIVCKYAVLDPERRNLTGTVKEIFDILQSEKQCRLSYQRSVDSGQYDDGGPVCGCQHKMDEGGPVPTEAYLLTYKKNGQTVTIDLSKYSDEDIKAEYEEEKMLNDKRVKGIASLEEQLKNFKGSILSKEYKDLEDTLKRTKSQLAITNEKILPFYERIINKDTQQLTDADYSDKLLMEQKVRTLIQLLSYKILINGKTKEDAFIDELSGLIYDGKEFHSKTDVESLAKKKYNFTDKQKVKELTEYAILKVGREIVRKYEYDVPEAYSRIVGLYNVQPYSTHRTTLSMQLQQFSTPIPFAYLMGVFCGDGYNNKILLEPTAGNGFLTISGIPENFIVNEIDRNRFNNLQKDNYRLALNQDALKPFPIPLKSLDGVLANPPFGAPRDGYVVDRFHITGLEQKIIVNALNYVKDDSKSAFIIGGWTEFTDKGTLQTFRDKNFFGYLWHTFNVVDVIQVNGDLYGKQGTVYPIRIVLLGGRKPTKGGFYPVRDASKDIFSEFSPHPVNTFEELYKRFKIHW